MTGSEYIDRSSPRPAEDAAKRTIDTSVLVGVALLVAVLIGNAVIAYRNTRQLDANSRWVVHTHEVLHLTDRALTALTDAETGQRGFLITGRDEFLQPYDAAISRLGEALAKLKNATADNPAQQQRVRKLEEMTAARLSLLKQGIDLRRRSADQAAAFITVGNGKAQMDTVRRHIAEMEQLERALLAEREKSSDTAYRVAVFAGLLTAGLSLVVLGTFVWLLKRSMQTRQRAIVAIAEQRERLRTTLASIGDGVISTDLEGRITNLNPVAQSLTGWTNSEAQGQPLGTVFRIVNEKTRDTVENPASRALREGVVVGLANHTILIAKDGTERAIGDSAAPIRCDEGKLVGCVLVFRDITERQKLWESSQRLVSLIESSDDAIISKSLDGIIRTWNPAAERLFGYTARDAVGRHISLLIPADRLAEEDDIIARIRAGQRVDHLDTVRVRKDGQPIHISLTISPVNDSDGRVIGASKIARDITERKRLESELRQFAEDLSEADRRKNEFLAMLAHELRNPLAPILNAVQVLRLKESTGDAVRTAAEMMERQLGQMVRLVDDLLDVSRISRGKIELRRGRIELGSVVHHAVEAAQTLTQCTEQELSIDLPLQPVYLNADPTRLAQVVGNLLNNACKFTDKSGRVSLVVEQDGEHVVIRVRDTGIGIAADQLPRIFEMFTQVDSSLERSASGLGLGLPLVKTLVEMHGGTVEARSAGLGEGSEFIVRLPALVESAAPSLEATSAVDAAATTVRRILVVDDNRDGAESLAMLLELTGNQTRTAYDGVEAVEAAAAFRPDMVLLDIGLPKQNGYEAARQIRQQPWGKNMVLVALTGWGQEEDRQKSKDAGFDRHLVKPVDRATLARLLAEFASGSSASPTREAGAAAEGS